MRIQMILRGSKSDQFLHMVQFHRKHSGSLVCQLSDYACVCELIQQQLLSRPDSISYLHNVEGFLSSVENLLLDGIDFSIGMSCVLQRFIESYFLLFGVFGIQSVLYLNSNYADTVRHGGEVFFDQFTVEVEVGHVESNSRILFIEERDLLDQTESNAFHVVQD